MLLAEKVVDGLYGIERFEGNFHEDGVPVAHCAVPKSGQLERLQFASVLALVRYEAGLRIYVVGQVEGLAAEVAQAANEVNGVEVRATLEHLLLLGVGHVDLRAFEDL